MVEFRRDPSTGELQAYRDGILVGPVVTMGDQIGEEDRDDSEQGEERG